MASTWPSPALGSRPLGARRRGHRHGQPPRRPPRRGPSSCTRPALRSVTTPVDLALQHLSPPSPSVSTLLRQTVVCPSHSAAGSSPAHKASGFSPTPTDEPEPNTGDALLRARRGWACRSVVVRDAPRTRPALRLAPRPAPPAPHAVLQVSHVPSTRCRVLGRASIEIAAPPPTARARTDRDSCTVVLGVRIAHLGLAAAGAMAMLAVRPKVQLAHDEVHIAVSTEELLAESSPRSAGRAPDIAPAVQSVRLVAAADEPSHRRHDPSSSMRPVEEPPSNVSRCNHSGHPRAEPPSQSGIAYRTRSCRRWGKSLCVSE